MWQLLNDHTLEVQTLETQTLELQCAATATHWTSSVWSPDTGISIVSNYHTAPAAASVILHESHHARPPLCDPMWLRIVGLDVNHHTTLLAY